MASDGDGVRDGSASPSTIYVATREQPIRKSKTMSSNQIGVLAVGSTFVILARGQDKNGRPLLHIGPTSDGTDTEGWIRKSDSKGLMIKALAAGEAAPSPEDLMEAAGTQDFQPQSKKGKSKKKNKKVDRGKSIDVSGEAQAEAEVQAVRQRKLDHQNAEKDRDKAALTIATLTQSARRGNMDREALGVKASTNTPKSVDVKLHRFEQFKLTVFLVANSCTALFGLICAYGIYTMRLADTEVMASSGGSNSSSKLMFVIVFSLFLNSVTGIYGATYLKLGVLRFYAFFLMLLICAQLSALMVLMLEVSGGASAQVQTTAADQLKLDSATAFQEQYCKGRKFIEQMGDLLGVNNQTEQATCLGRYQVDSNDMQTDAFNLMCAGLPHNGTCMKGSGPGACTQCGYDLGCSGAQKNGPQPSCAAVGMLDCDSGTGCIPAYEVSDAYCTQAFQTEFERTNNLAINQADEEVDADESMCPSECKYAERVYTTQEFNVTELSEEIDFTSSIWGADSHSICDCDPEQDTEEKKQRFLDCMHAFYLKNIGFVILVIAATVVAEVAMGMFGWTVLRPWAKRRLEALQTRPSSHSQRSKHWNIVAAFTLPVTEEDVVRKEMAIVTETWYFEGTVVGVVSLSMYVLAMTSPTVPPPEDEVLSLRMLEVFVTVFLTMELGLEMIVTINARRYEVYFKNPWHWVDYLVLIVSWMYLLDPDNQFTAVCRALRVVRPMRSISFLSSFQLIGDCLRNDADIFMDVTSFTLLMIFTFSLVGLTSYHGAVQYTCGIPVNPLCEEELDGICDNNVTGGTWIADPGEIVDLRVPRESWTKEEDPMTESPTALSEEGSTTQRLVDEGKLAPHPGLDYYLLTGITSVEVPSLDLLRYVYGGSWENRHPLEGLPCPTTLRCGPVRDKDNPGWWQTPLADQEEPVSRCFKLNPPRVLTEDDSGLRGFDDISQGFITFLVSMSGDGGMEQVPTGLLNAGATSAYFAWTFFFLVSVLLNFVTLNLLLAMCVATLENVNAEFKKVEKDKQKTKKLQKHAAAVKKKKWLQSAIPTGAVSSVLKGDKVNEELGKLDDALTETYDKIMEGFDDFDEQRTAMEEALESLDWSGAHFGTVRNECKIFVRSSYYRNGVVLMILGWTATLMFKTGATTQANLTEEETETLTQSFNDLELGLLIGFVLEIVVKLLGIGWSLFKRNQESVLDLFILLLTCVAFSTSYFGFTIEYGCRARELVVRNNDTATMAVDDRMDAAVAACIERTISEDTRKAFQMLRVVQISRMLYKHESIYIVMQKIFKNWKAILGIFIFVVFSMSMFSIVGMHLLGKGLGYAQPYEQSGLCCTDSAPGDEEGTLYFRSNFETFWDGMLSTTQIILGDDWMLIMLWYMNNSSMKEYYGVTATFFTVAFLWVFGVLFNLFVAVLLINFGVDEDDKIPKQKEKCHRAREQKDREVKRREKNQKHSHSDVLAAALQADAAQAEAAGQQQKNKSTAAQDGGFDLVKALEADRDPNHKSLFLINADSAFRVGAAKIETHPWFLRGMIGLIFTSMIVLALEDEAVLEQATWKTRTQLMEYAVWSYFVAEMILKTITSGFIWKSGPSTPYLGNQRNRNDFVFLVVSAMAQMPSIAEYLKTQYEVEDRHLRILRGIGPMVGLLQSHEIRIVTGSFYLCLPGVATVMVPMIFVLLMFALLGFELYHGRLRRCLCPLPDTDLTGGDEVSGLLWCNADGEALECNASYTGEADSCYGYGNLTTDFIEIANRTGCELRGYRWDNDPIVGGFDDVLSAAVTLFKGSTTGATDLLYITMDASEVKDGLPGRNQNPSAAIFLTVFHAVFTMFLLNIFIGVMSSTFSIQTGKAIETDGQKRWNQLVKDVGRFSPTYSPEEKFRPDERAKYHDFRLKAFNFASHYAFNNLCIGMVVGNTILLITEHYPASTSYIDYTDSLNLIFITWFAIEFFVKIVGFGPRNYFSNGWLVFDFIIIASTWGIRLSSSTAAGMDLFKVARCLKIMLLAKRLETLVDLMHVVGACITRASNVAIIMLVITYTYAIMGMKLYGAATMLPQTNFSDFSHAMKLLIQVMTGQSYGKIIAMLMAENYSEHGALLYFISYYVFSVFICTNLFIVTVLDNFDVASRAGQVIKTNEFWGFTYAWGELTVGAHAVPVLTSSQGMDFVKTLRKIVDKKKAALDLQTVAIKIRNIPINMARAEILEEKFSKYGEIENIELRRHHPLSGAYITFKDKEHFKKSECFGDEIILGKDASGEPNVLTLSETRHGDFAHGIVSISMPNNKRTDRGTIQIDILRGDGIENRIQPYVKVTSKAKHLHHGGRHVTKITRAVNRNSVIDDATGLPTVIVIAPPGAQKYRYCKQVAKRYDLVHIDVGEMLRQEDSKKVLEYHEEKQKGKHGALSPGKAPENWFISQEEEEEERQAKRTAELNSDGTTSPSSSGSGALTPGRKLRMSRSEKQHSMGAVKSDTKPEDHLKRLKPHKEHHPALHSGKLVGDKFVLPLIRAMIEKAELENKGVVISGFPRTKRQANHLKAINAIPGAVVVLEVDEDECFRGCKDRRIDPENGKVYDLHLRPPKSEEVLGRLVSRRDDHDPKIIETRLKRHAHHSEATIDALARFAPAERLFRLNVAIDPNETLQDIIGLMEVSFGDATHYNADASPLAPVPAVWDSDTSLFYHVNEHSNEFEFEIYDAANFSLKPFGKCSVNLEQMKSMAKHIDDRDVDWADENLDELLSMKSLNPINVMSTVNKTIKEAEKFGKVALNEVEKAANHAAASAAKAAEMALETVGFESSTLDSIAEDGAKNHQLDMMDENGNITCSLQYQLRYHTKEWVPDWNFLSEFGEDNPNLKPSSCGIEGWVERKGGADKTDKSGTYKGKWMFITQHPPQLCIMHVASELELRQVMKGRQGAIPDDAITRLQPHEIHQLRNGFSRRRSNKPSKVDKITRAREEDCHFEFTTIDEINHLNQGMHDGTQSPSRRHGVLHVQIVQARDLPHMDAKGDTDGVVVIEMEGVHYKTRTVEDSIAPEWNEACSFSVFNKESPLVVSLYDEDSHSHDDIIGEVKIDIRDLKENQPQDVWKDIKAVDDSPPKSQWSGEKTGLGQVKLVLTWADIENAEVLMQRWTEDDVENHRLREDSTVWRIRCASNEVKYSWMQAIAWVERGCKGKMPPKISAPSICERDMKRVRNDPSLIDLPISKCRHLLFNLQEFECLGLKHRRDDTLYATFQLELHAWKTDYRKDKRKKNTGAGASIDSYHGLDFDRTLKRLCLLRYGKDTSLSYVQMMDEFEHERAHVALHVIQTCILAWVYRRRGRLKEYHHRIHLMWKKDHRYDGELLDCYFHAVIAIRHLRLMCLAHLNKLVAKQNPELWHGKWDPTKVKQTREERKRRKKQEKEEERQAAKDAKEKEYNERHDREKTAQRARADDALLVRRSGRHKTTSFENPVLFSDSDDEPMTSEQLTPGGFDKAHLAPNTALTPEGPAMTTFDLEPSAKPYSFETEELPRRRNGSQERAASENISRKPDAVLLTSSDDSDASDADDKAEDDIQGDEAADQPHASSRVGFNSDSM